MYGRRLRGRLRERTAWLGWVFLAFGPIGLLFFHRTWSDCVLLMAIGGGILLWLRPWRPEWHDAWIVRVEPEPADVAAGRSFEPYYIPECRCGWDDPYYDDAQDARVAAEEHAKGRVEPDHRQRFESVTD